MEHQEGETGKKQVYSVFAQHTLGMQEGPVLLIILLNASRIHILICVSWFPFGQGPDIGRVEGRRGRL